MTKTNVILLVCFALTFGAGASLGMLLTKAKPLPAASPKRSMLADELGLSPQQQEQMKKIWSESMGSVYRQQGEQRTALAADRDQAITALLSDAQRASYDAIRQEYSRKIDELSADRKRTFDSAVERTKQMLTPDQAHKYDELMTKQRSRSTSGPSGEHGGWHHRGASSRPSATTTTSKPVAIERPPQGGD